jgi:gas vesicle protein
MSKGKLITGVVAGAAAGAILGILMAPDKGSATRKKIAKKGADLTGSVKDGFGKLGETISDKYNSIKCDAKDLMEKGKDKATELNDNYKTEKAF